MLARFGRDLDLDLFSDREPVALAQRQEAERLPGAQIDEGPFHAGVDGVDAPHRPRLQPDLRGVTLSLYKETLETAVADDHAPDLAGRIVDKGFELAHSARQPAPASRLTVSCSGRPTMAG